MQRDECTLNPTLAVLYHCIFMLVCSYIMIQLVIGIILDGVQAQAFLDEMEVGQVGEQTAGRTSCCGSADCQVSMAEEKIGVGR